MNGFLGTPLPQTAIRPEGTRAILAALEKIRPDQLVVYHRGLLAKDRHKHFSGSNSFEIDRVADKAMRLAEKNQVDLTQFRAGQGSFFYVATGKATSGMPSSLSAR